MKSTGAKNHAGAQLGLAASAPPPGAGSSMPSTLAALPRTDSFPDLIEYAYGVEAWRCTQFNLLRAELETITPELLPQLHELLALNARTWRIVRLLFGVQPVLPRPDYPAEELREWGRLELCEALGLTVPQLKAELDAARGVWLGAMTAPGALVVAPPPPRGGRAGPPDELALEEDPILKRYHFQVVLTMEERNWFVPRVREFERVLKEPIVAGLAYNALMTDLRCRRLNLKLDQATEKEIGGKEWKDTLRLAEELAGNYNALIKEILDLFPAASNIAGKMALQPVCATITKAFQEFYARNDRRLIDGVFTATEVQVECRRSVQMPQPRYRAGLVVYLNAARQGLFDPRWKAPFTPAELARLDAAWKASYVAAAEAAGLAVPDLLADTPAGEYPDLVLPEGVISPSPFVRHQIPATELEQGPRQLA